MSGIGAVVNLSFLAGIAVGVGSMLLNQSFTVLTVGVIMTVAVIYLTKRIEHR